MKTNRILSLLCLPAIAISALAFAPKTETKSRWMRVTDIERTDSALRVGIQLRNPPHYWVTVASTTRLTASEDTTQQYKLISSENIELDKKIWMPESGSHDGVLLFEPVPAGVKIVDLVETDRSDFGSCTFGIHLDQPDTFVNPELITISDITADGKPDAGKWKGFDPKEYSDIKFYNKNGSVHLKGRIPDYSPKYGVSTLSVKTQDDFTNEGKINVGEINADGTFSIDIPLTYPQFDYLQIGNISRNIFLIPGDTISIVASMAQKIDNKRMRYEPEIFGFEGKPSDGVVVNMLVDSVYDRYGLQNLYQDYRVKNSDDMLTETYRQNEKLAALLDSALNDLPDFIGDMPVSSYVKDLLTVAAIGRICDAMEGIQMDFKYANSTGIKTNGDGYAMKDESQHMDDAVYMRPWLKHKDLIYNNPLMLCYGWVLPNRWYYNSQFFPSRTVALGLSKIPGTIAYSDEGNLQEVYANEMDRLDSIGVGNCFVAQLTRTTSLAGEMKRIKEPSSEALERYNDLVAYAAKHSNYDLIDKILMSELNNYVKNVMIAENRLPDTVEERTSIPDSPAGKILSRIIEPYKGNVLFLDFWGIGCGPCRAGMKGQKPVLEKLSDRPFKALYIAKEEEKDACNEWLEKEGIKGEHIFISNDDWIRLTGLLNFSAIPFEVLIDKEGRIVKTHFHFYEQDPEFQKVLDE